MLAGALAAAVPTHLLGQRAGLLGRVQDLVVEDGEVEGEAEPDGVRGLHVLLADVEGLLVGLLGVLHRVFTTQTLSPHSGIRTYERIIKHHSSHQETTCGCF